MSLQIQQSHLDLELEPHSKMKKLLLFFIFFWSFSSNSYSEIAYIDINYILNNSEIGKSLNNHLKKIKNQYLEENEKIESEIIKKEKELLAKKNILEKSEFENNLSLLSKEVEKYNSKKKFFQENFNEIKLQNTKKILNYLNPIITRYVEINSISLVIPKKNIIVGKKNLDITDNVIKLLNENAKKLEF